MEAKRSSLDYLAARVAAALATDTRTNALDVTVRVTETTIVVHGVVSCGSRREAAERVVFELLPPGTRLDNRLRVERFAEPLGAEPVEE